MNELTNEPLKIKFSVGGLRERKELGTDSALLSTFTNCFIITN